MADSFSRILLFLSFFLFTLRLGDVDKRSLRWYGAKSHLGSLGLVCRHNVYCKLISWLKAEFTMLSSVFLVSFTAMSTRNSTSIYMCMYEAELRRS